ncbi:hypothetical protein I316_07431 [Kwoniella heveanensis BCC8398]|uniref:Uncharacterized protein n=1 Tax=Kwoniella heveanensis BCC8398 TaxID=1296120 RepID=A0A1B9GIY4_9TREE|nr:hypothetical protein I316_07431 [Kwoniella heveanensis BCC8398]
MFRQAIASVECTSSGDVERRTVLQRELGDFNVTDELIDAMIQGCGSEKGTVTPLPSDIDGVNDNHKAREGDKSGKSGTSQLAASDATLTPGQVLAKQHSIYCTKV